MTKANPWTGTGPRPKRVRKSGSNPIGRPTKYSAKLCQQMIDYFSIDLFELDAKGKRTAYLNDFPTFEDFAHKFCHTYPAVLFEWTKRFPEFNEAWDTCRALQKNLLMRGGMTGAYQSNFCIFLSKNLTDLKDKIETESNINLGGSVNITINPIAGKG